MGHKPWSPFSVALVIDQSIITVSSALRRSQESGAEEWFKRISGLLLRDKSGQRADLPDLCHSGEKPEVSHGFNGHPKLYYLAIGLIVEIIMSLVYN